MKITNVLSTLMLMGMLIMFSCISEEAVNTKGRLVTAEKILDLNDQLQLNELAKKLAKEPSEIYIIKDASIVDLTDSQGDYKALSFQYRADDQNVKMIVPLKHVSSTAAGLKIGSGFNAKTYYTVAPDACEMKCTIIGAYAESKYQVFERCKSQQCSCESGEGKSSTSVTFSEMASN